MPKEDYTKEENILREFTGTHNIDQIYKMGWNTEDVIELMRKASQKE